MRRWPWKEEETVVGLGRQDRIERSINMFEFHGGHGISKKGSCVCSWWMWRFFCMALSLSACSLWASYRQLNTFDNFNEQLPYISFKIQTIFTSKTDGDQLKTLFDEVIKTIHTIFFLEVCMELGNQIMHESLTIR